MNETVSGYFWQRCCLCASTKNIRKLPGMSLFCAYPSQGDTYNHLIRRIDISTGNVTTLAGVSGSPGTTNGAGVTAKFSSPYGVAMDAVGSVALVVSGGGVESLENVTCTRLVFQVMLGSHLPMRISVPMALGRGRLTSSNALLFSLLSFYPLLLYRQIKIPASFAASTSPQALSLPWRVGYRGR